MAEARAAASNRRVARLNRRTLTSSWLLLLGIQYLLVIQTWFTVRYEFDGTVKTLTATGLAAWPMTNGAVLFSLVGLAGIFLSRGPIRRILAWLVAIVGLALAVLNLAGLAQAVPPAVNAMVEKASGIAGGSETGVSAAIVSSSSNGLPIMLFAFTSLALALLQLVIPFAVGRWTAADGRDKYQRQAQPATTQTETSKDSNIGIWDSQR